MMLMTRLPAWEVCFNMIELTEGRVTLLVLFFTPEYNSYT